MHGYLLVRWRARYTAAREGSAEDAPAATPHGLQRRAAGTARVALGYPRKGREARTRERGPSPRATPGRGRRSEDRRGVSTEIRSVAGIAALGAAELRVLGCLLEKQRTTPDAYPLSLNALRLACNQSTNRDPVVHYDEARIRDALHRLERRGLVRMASGAGSRAIKYRHLLADRLPLDSAEQAVLCVLMLRGPQTPGELKQRGERMHAFAQLAEVHDALARLIERELVQRLARRPGHKEERYAQLLQGGDGDGGGEAGAGADGAAGTDPLARPPSDLVAAPDGGAAGAAWRPGPTPPAVQPTAESLAELSQRVDRLERELAALRAAVEPSPAAQPPAARTP
jgi:uncharacterized protein